MQTIEYPGTTYGAVNDPCALLDISPLVPEIFGTAELTDAAFTDSRWDPRAGGTTMHCAKLAGGEYQGATLDGQVVFSIYVYADPSKIKKDFKRIRRQRMDDLKDFGLDEGYTTIRRSPIGNPAWGLYKADPDPATGREYVLVFIDDNMLLEFSLMADRSENIPFPMSHEAFRAQADAVIQDIASGLR
jgi:hypothetical protein